jgi:hypothetical protein
MGFEMYWWEENEDGMLREVAFEISTGWHKPGLNQRGCGLDIFQHNWYCFIKHFQDWHISKRFVTLRLSNATFHPKAPVVTISGGITFRAEQRR